MRSIFDLCTPRADVLAGRMKDEEFAADLAAVVQGKAPREYGDPALFFRYTYPTRGLQSLLETVCRRLSGQGGELNSVIRLDTQYGGGKTHGLIALVHAVRGMQGFSNSQEFIDPALIPTEPVRVAALDGENSDPANGMQLEDGVRARSIWGEMAYQLAGLDGYERIRSSDEKHLAPGTNTLIELFGGAPTLILIDEVSVYLRKASRAFPDAVDQFPAFLQALIKAVSSTPKCALVCTLAIRASDEEAQDAYKQEQQMAVSAFAESESIASRKLLQIDPTEEDETINVIQRRLFEEVDEAAAADVVDAYIRLWERNKEQLAPDPFSPETRDEFRRGYPFHPETLNVMVKKMSSLSTFQRTRGMLRLLSRTVNYLWKNRPIDAYAIHPHHIDPGNLQIRQEITTRLGQQVYAPALSSDVAAAEGKDPSTAQRLDQVHFPGQAPITSYVARTIFLNTMAYGDGAQGVSPDRIRYSVASPSYEPALVEEARKRFAGESLYLDDRPGAPMRFRVEPNLTQLINREMGEVDVDELRNVLNTQIQDLYTANRSDFNLIPFPAAAYEIPDDIGDGRPYLILLHHDSFAMTENQEELPNELVRMATQKGTREDLRLLQNNLVFVVADKKQVEELKQIGRKGLALEALLQSDMFKDLQKYQQDKLHEQHSKSSAVLAIAILQCYRHLFYPTMNKQLGTSDARLGHTMIELQNASDTPGNGQLHIKRALRDQKKLLSATDEPDAPTFVRDQTPLKVKGSLSTLELRNEFRKAPNLSILLDDEPLIKCIQLGIAHEHFIYREDDLVWGATDPTPSIRLSNNAFVHTMTDAREKQLWPRPVKEPEGESTPEGKAAESSQGMPTGHDEGAAPSAVSGDMLFGDDMAATPEVPLKVFDAEGPLRGALVALFEKVRAQKVTHLQQLRIKFFNAQGAWSVHQSLVTYRDAEITCNFDFSIHGDDIEHFGLQFSGGMQKANQIKSLIEPQLRSAKEQDVEVTYTLRFTTPFDVIKSNADALISTLTKYGAAEAYVEAEASRE